jgi:hypothetical protein
MNIANNSDGSKSEPLSPSVAGKMPRNGCMMRSVARNTHCTNGVPSLALNSSRKNAIARMIVHAIAKP